ncbi:unnamed protein product [Coregonus sp. 'balchen']|nr:unnamed protein product [Coregonus sp. 'balchen']
MQFRTVLEVKVVDVQKRRNPSKHYVYLINVTYSDSTSHVISRRYSKFFDLQMQILDKFPQLLINSSHLRTYTRDTHVNPHPETNTRLNFVMAAIISKLTKSKMKPNQEVQSPFNDWQEAVMRLPNQISQSEEVLRFFETKAEDLNPPKE